MKITNKDFSEAKKAAKKDIADSSKAHRNAIECLTARCPNASLELIADVAWQCVLAAR